MASRHLVVLLDPPGSGKAYRCRRLRDTGAVVYDELDTFASNCTRVNGPWSQALQQA